MDQAVKVPCRFLNLLSHIVVTIQVKHISDKVEGILIILDIGVEPCKIEAVCEIVFVNLAEIFVASRRDELPANLSAHVIFYPYLNDNTKAG